MSFFNTLEIASSALLAERTRVDLASANLANANSTRTPEGGPYKRQDPVFSSVSFGPTFGSDLDREVRKVEVRRIVTDQSAPRQVFNPSHPDANGEGMVLMPNVDVGEELVNLMSAQRAYEANLNAIQVSREMAQRAIRIGQTS